MAEDTSRKQNNKGAGLPDNLGINYNLLTVLLASEALKPQAAGKRIELDEDMKSLCRAALIILKQDKAVFEGEYIRIADRKTASLGTMAARLGLGESEYAVESEEMIENRMEGGGGRERALPEMGGIPEDIKTPVNNLRYAVKSIERALEAGSWSVLDAEKALRCISELAGSDVRKKAESLSSASKDAGTHDLRENAGSILSLLAKKGNSLLEDDIYTASRRLVLSSFSHDGNILDEMDGILKRNPVTGKSEELGLLDRMDFRADGETGIRYLSPESLIEYTKTFTSRVVYAGKQIPLGRMVNLDISLSKENQAVLEGVLKAAGNAYSASSEHTEAQKNTERFLLEAIRRLDLEDIEKDAASGLYTADKAAQEKKKKESTYAAVERSIEGDGRAARKWIKAHLDKDFVNDDWIRKFSEAGMETMRDRKKAFSLGDIGSWAADAGGNYTEAELMHIPYMTLYFTYMQMKNYCNKLAISLDLKEYRSKEGGTDNSSEFPFEAPIPVALRDPSKATRLFHEATMTVLRLDALLTGYIDPSSTKGAELIEKAAKIREKAVNQLLRAKETLVNDILTLDEKEVEESFRKALKGKDMKPLKSGWFKTEELRNLFIKSASEAFDALTNLAAEDPDAAVMAETAARLDESVQSVVKDERADRRVYDTDDGFKEIQAPLVSRLTPAARFRTMTNYPLSYLNDTSVKEKDGDVYYSRGEDWEVYHNKMKEEAVKAISSYKSDKSDKTDDAARDFNGVMEIINAVRASGGGYTTCVSIMDNAFEKAKEIYIRDYIEDLKEFKKAVYMMDTLNLNGLIKTEGKDNSILRDFMVTGKLYGEKIMCGTAAETLDRMGFSKDASSVMNFSRADSENGKWDLYKNLSPLSKYIMSRTSLAITSSALKQIEKDTAYYEMQCSADSLWYDEEGEKGDTAYYALTKSPLPFATDETMEEELKDGVLDREAAAALASAFAGTRLQKEEISKAFTGYAEECRSDFALREERIRKDLAATDVKAAVEDAERLRTLLILFSGSDEEREEIEETLTSLVLHNPAAAEKVSAFRNRFSETEGDFNSWKMALADEADGLAFMSPLAEANRENGNRKRLLSIEEEFAAKTKENAEVLKNELESEMNILSEEQQERINSGEDKRSSAVISSENRALADVAFTGLFARESRLLDNMMQVLDSDMVHSLGPDIKTARTSARAAVKLLDEAVDNDLYAVAAAAVIKSFDEKGYSGERLPLPDGVPGTDDGRTSPRDKRFNKAMTASFENERELSKKPLLMKDAVWNEREGKYMTHWGELERYEGFYPARKKSGWQERFRNTAKEDMRGIIQSTDGREFSAGEYTKLRKETARIMAEVAAEKEAGIEGIKDYFNAANRLGSVLLSQGIKKENTLEAVMKSKLRKSEDDDVRSM